MDHYELRKDYDELKPSYQMLVDHVNHIITSSVKKKKIKIHSTKSRVKEFSSFSEKVERKGYKEPFSDCTDFAGCRVVCLFLNQVEEIKKIIQEEFDVIEVTDKRSSKKFDQFGYLSLHMLVKIPKHRLKFVEYSELKDLVCEVQIRTILQEAWAEIEHYLNYKSTKEEKNEELLRKMFSLSGMFEVADSTFEEISKGFSKMVHKAKDNSISALNIYKFSKDTFNWDEEFDRSLERKFYKLSNEIKKLNISSLDMISKLIQKHNDVLLSYEKTKEKANPLDLIRASLALEYGKKYDLIYGVKGFSDKIKKNFK